jgi:hypothetical protein
MEEEEVSQAQLVKTTSLSWELLKSKHISQSSSEEVKEVMDLSQAEFLVLDQLMRENPEVLPS